MSLFADQDSAICAIATPPGSGGVAMIRLSGEGSDSIIKKSCSFVPEKCESHKVYYGHMNHDGVPIDEVLVTYFEKGRSFTGDKTFEISCHGSPIVAQQILDVLIDSGARIAEPGEFTFRAFMSGRIDLVQAEAVLDLVESESRRASSLALRQLKGSLSQIVEDIERDLIQVLAHVEANIDFAAEDIEIESSQSLSTRLESVIDRVLSLISTYKQGKAIHEGIDIALIGVPNVGKSSLLNALVNEDKAIVTDVEGTTRDVVEGFFEYEGARFNVFDTAGMRATDDKIEKMGIERTLKKIEDCEFKVIVLDSEKPLLPDSTGIEFEQENTTILFNKVDLIEDRNSLLKVIGDFEEYDVSYVSAQTGEGLDSLKSKLANRAGLKGDQNQTAILTNSRHLQSLSSAYKSLKKGLSLLQNQESPDFIAFELMDAVKAIQSMLGKKFDDEVMDQVFREFCLGK